jgi:hypothetical protein
MAVECVACGTQSECEWRCDECGRPDPGVPETTGGEQRVE